MHMGPGEIKGGGESRGKGYDYWPRFGAEEDESLLWMCSGKGGMVMLL